jgi:hypothetical protein
MTNTSIAPLITDWISSASNLLSAMFVGVGLAVAWFQLGSWRDQAKTLKKVDLAETILSTSFEILDVMASARNPFSSIPMEKAKDPRYIYQRRMQFIQDNAGLYATLRKSQIRARIFVFDGRINTAIESIFDVRRDFWNAADMLVEYAVEKPATSEESNMLKEARTVLFARSKDDKTQKRLDDAVAVLETLLGEIVRQHK